MTMEFGLSAEQQMLGETLGRLLDEVADLNRVRAVMDGDAIAFETCRAKLSDLGIPAILVPERHGGMGLGLLDAVVAAERLGASVVPLPYTASSIMAPVGLMKAATTAQQDRWLPRLARGEATIGVAISEQAAGARNGAGLVATGTRLSGRAQFALDARGADAFIVADKKKRLYLVDAGSAGLHIDPVATIDRTRSIAHLTFDDVEVEPLDAERSASALKAMIEAGRIALAADTLGAGWAMIDKAVAYSLERKQFGRVIGSFQAVKHLCAEMVAELEPCRALIWYAAHSFDALPDETALMSAHAKSLSDEAGRFVARTATEVHGGIGFTDLLGLHFWFKRIGLNRQLLGAPERVRTEIAVDLGWTTAPVTRHAAA